MSYTRFRRSVEIHGSAAPLAVNIVESYFELTDEERNRYQRLFAREGYQEVKEMEATWGDKMMYLERILTASSIEEMGLG